jgi:iron complex outermembrane recepter protein
VLQKIPELAKKASSCPATQSTLTAHNSCLFVVFSEEGIMQVYRWIWLSSVFALLFVLKIESKSATAETGQSKQVLSTVSDLPRASVTVKEWMVQIEATIVRVNSIKVEPSDVGINITLETMDGKPLQIDATKFRAEGNTLIAEIANAVLTLPDTSTFTANNPTNEVATVQVVQQDSSTIRVTVTGVNKLPQQEVTLKTGGLAYSLNPMGEEPDEEIVVTGEGQQGYRVPNASTATRTNTPLRDIPQSIQVVPQEVIRDQAGTNIRDAVRNVSGVVEGDNFGGNLDSFIIRGFFGTILRNGFRGRSFGQFATETTLNEVSNLERIEVLKGPASVLYGNAEPGGVINLVSKQPLKEPYYAADLQIGSFEFIKPSIDLAGPLTTDRSLSYRLNATYQSASGFRKPFDNSFRRFFISPVLRWDISKQTNLTVEFAYLNDRRPFDQGIVAFGDGIADIPYSRNLGEPDDLFKVEQLSIGYRLEHSFNENLKIRNAFTYLRARNFDYKVQPNDLDETTGLLPRDFDSNDDTSLSYGLQTDLNAKFKTGSIQHNLLIGFDLTRQSTEGTNRGIEPGTAPAINIFNPVYLGKPDLSEFTTLFRDNYGRADTLGLFLQDQITVLKNLKLLIGGRFDAVSLRNEDRLSSSVTTQNDSAFTPRLGLVYQPIQPISLYASYGRSFNPNFARSEDNQFLKPEQGTQYEVGIKAELNPRLSLNLAAYWLTKTNIATTDPNNIDFSIPIGEIRSRGIELDIAGEILPGWKIIASYTNTSSKVTESNDYPIGLKTALVPDHAASLWTTYELQRGTLRGLGFGLGLYYLGDRPGDFNNSYTLPSFIRTDAAIFFRRKRWRAAINIKNLFNEQYIESVAYGRSRITPGAPFTVVGSFSVEF